MNDHDLKVLMRQNELMNRQTTARNIGNILRNIEHLRSEPLTEEERALHKEAVTKLAQYNLEVQREGWGGLSRWKKLWYVLTGKV